MIDGEWLLEQPGSSLSWGTPAHAVFNRRAPSVGDIKIRTQDADRDGGDGVVFGLDYFGGMTVTFDLGFRASTEAEVRALVSEFGSAWRGDSIRLSGGVATLRSQYVGSTREITGRPRRFAADLQYAHTGYATALATFDAGDTVFYSASASAAHLGFVTEAVGGLLAPLSAPLRTTTTSDRSHVIRVPSGAPVWPVIEFHGPAVTPEVEVFDRWRCGLTTTLAAGDVVTVDPSPGVRSITRLDGASVAGTISRRSSRLATMSLPPGTYQAALHGASPTGTGFVRLSWRSVSATP